MGATPLQARGKLFSPVRMDATQRGAMQSSPAQNFQWEKKLKKK